MSDSNEQQQTADITNLQESFLQQQEKISALKELVRKSGAAHGSSKSAAQEKVKNIAERLMISKAKSRQGLNVSTYSTEVASSEAALGAEQRTGVLTIPPDSPMTIHSSTPNPTPSKPLTSVSLFSTPGSEKIALMRQQLEQNKLRMAQKASSKQHLELLVSQLKEKFDSTQQCLEDTSELGRSMSDLSNLLYTPVSRERHKSATDLSSQNFSLEKERIKFLENRCRLLEKQLEKEKQNNANRHYLPTNNSSLENRIKELEEDLASKQKELEEKENFHTEELAKLRSAVNTSCSENDVILLRDQLENLSKENARLIEEMEKLHKQVEQQSSSAPVEDSRRLLEEVEQLQLQLESCAKETSDLSNLKAENKHLKEEVNAQQKRIHELNEINDVLETTRCDLASKNTQLEEQIKQLQADIIQEKLKNSEENFSQLQSTTEQYKNPDTDSQVKAEMAKQIQELMDEITEMRTENRRLQESIEDNVKLEINDSSIAEKIASLEATIESQREDLVKSQETLMKSDEELMEKTIELNVLNANFKVLEEQLENSSKNKPLFSSTSVGTQGNSNPQLESENQQLRQKLDESNKAMIKLKLKCKQSEKQIEKLKKVSDLHSEVVKLAKEKDQLQHKVIELEDEKGQWQLTQMESNVPHCHHEDILKEYEQKVEALSESLREKQQQCDALKQGEQTRVTSELIEIQLEEQVKELIKEVTSLRNELDSTEKSLQTATERIDVIQNQKDELDKKLEHYLNENIELLDKVEKLSKSSSSAESIEIVERLTQQEKQELEEFNKRLEIGASSEEASSHKDAVNELTQTEMNPELTESLNKLREESTELMSKIELFTTERREVLEKMENLNSENHDLLQRIEDLTQENVDLSFKLNESKQQQEVLMVKLDAANKEKDNLSVEIAESRAHKNQLSQELTSLQQSSEVVAALDNGETLFDKCEKSLSKLNCELEAYRKANDKKSKFNVSKKLAKEAENAHSQLSELLQKVKEASSAVETVTVVETVVAVTAPNGKALAEYEQLTAQNRELKATIVELRRLLDEARDAQEDQGDNRFVEDKIPAIQSDPDNDAKLREAVQQNNIYEDQLTHLQSRVEDLTRELREANEGLTEKSDKISTLSEEIGSLRKLAEDFDRLVDSKEMNHEKQIEHLTRLRKELESKCDTYEQEMEILQTLVAEQKQQLIEAYKEHEHEINVKLLALQQQEEQARELKQELADLKQTSALAGSELTQDLQNECEKLREALKINKHLVQEQVDELSNKQETIDTLNQQIIDLYKTMEENANKIIEKEDEIAYLQEMYDNNKQLMKQLEVKSKEFESNVKQLESSRNQIMKEITEKQSHESELLLNIKELEQRNKDQLDKLKKYAANLKKRTQQCQELEHKLSDANSKLLDPQELNSLRVANKELEQQLEQTRHELSTKKGELVDLVNIRNTLEQEVKQLLLAVDEKQLCIQSLQTDLSSERQHSSDWGENSNGNVELQEQLLICCKDLEAAKTEVETIKTTLFIAQKSVAELEKQLHETEHIRSELKDAQNTILKLEGNLVVIRQETSDWGHSEESDQLREELICTQENLKLKVREIEELRQSLMAAHEQQNDWGNESSNKSADYDNVSRVLADKNIKLEKAETVMQELENVIIELRENNRENQQKIKELTIELQNVKAAAHKHSDMETLRNEFMTQEQKLQQVTEDLKAKSIKFEKSKAVIKERNAHIQRLQVQLRDLQEKLTAMPEEEILSPKTQAQLGAFEQQPLREQLDVAHEEYRKLNEQYISEKAQFQNTITRLETLHDGIQAKLQEDMSYIETLEQENVKFKDKICRLEECVACFEERRASMERKVNLMDAQLQTRSEEHTKTEDELIYRLNMLSEHDEVIAQRLIDSQSDKEEVEESFRKLQMDYNQLQTKYSKLEREYSEFKTESSIEFEQELIAIRDQLSKAESDIERQKAVYDGKLAAKATELDGLECELAEQLEKVNEEKQELSEQLERMTDDCSAQQNDILRLQETVNSLEQAKAELERESSWLRMQSESAQQDVYEIQELRMQSMQDKTEIETLRHQIESLSSNHENELQALRTQIAELDTLRMQVGQNQTDDQVFIETENKRLTDLLAEKEAVIENYQRQNLQLQMAAAAAASTSSQSDPFALTFGLPQQTANVSVQNTDQAADSLEVERLNQDLNERNALVCRIQQDLANLQSEYNVVLEANQKMQRQVMVREQDATNLQTLQGVATALSDTQTSDVIPAPPMFFTSEPSVRTPFDDIIQPQIVDNLSAQAPLPEQPTIEDLQRNVSDLEKHAQDLEHKLVMRNQREADYEDRLKDFENRLQEREHLLQQTKTAAVSNQSECAALLNQLKDLQNKIQRLEELLQVKDQELDTLRRQQSQRLEEEYLQKTIKSMERQIVTDAAIPPTLDMFFGNSASQDFEPFVITEASKEPVVEELIVPKKVYDCHPEVRKGATSPAAELVEGSLDIGDGWGDSWGNSEAAAEAEHFAKQSAPTTSGQPSLVPKEQLLELQMQELNERLQELQLALERSEDQKKELHIKSGKLMKKLKEYKVKIDELQSCSNSVDFRKSSSVESNSMFGDLDAAIQEELKNQIKALESKLAEQTKLHESLTAEKDKLLKRVDVLTAGNERMAEMKERQDMEVQMYQARIRDLQQKLQTLDDWGNEDSSSTENTKQLPEVAAPTMSASDNWDLQKKVDALTLEVQDVTSDRLELQAMLDEEKSNSQRVEQALATLRLQLSSMEEENSIVDATQQNNLKIELQDLRESYNSAIDENKKLCTDFKTQTDALSQSQASEQRLQAELDALQVEVENLRETLINTKQSLIDLESELSALKQHKEKQLDAAISGDNQRTSEGVKRDIEELMSQKTVLEERCDKLMQENEDLGKKIVNQDESIHRLQAENEYLKQSTATQYGEDLSAQLQERESEITHLKQRINDLMNEDQTEKLVLEILTKNQEIHMLKMQVKHLEEDKHELENNLSLQLTKEMQANKEEPQKESLEETNKIENLETKYSELLDEKRQMEEELQVLNNHVLESLQQEDKMKALTLELDTKNIQISELRKTVEAMQSTGKEDASVDYVALNSQWEAIVEQRCSEIAKMWQEHLAQREQDFKVQEESLHEEIRSLRANQASNVSGEPLQRMVSVETTSSSTPASESMSPSGPTSAESSQDASPLRIRPEDNEANADAIIEKMQAALESQEMEIVTLKEQLAIRSAEYARLAAQYDPFKLQNTTSHIGVIESKKPSGNSDVAMVSKSELDLALYMLHQRDMRCEEMTLELVSLLEERDTLQLKLSNTLRQVEAIKSQAGGLSEGYSTAIASSVDKTGTENIANVSVAGSTAGNVDDELNQKLSQLQTVSHSKDKVIKEEREQRSRQMEMLQQDVAKMPQAAVSELIGSDMSQSNQSTSTVLLNWLWGNKSGNAGGSQPDF